MCYPTHGGACSYRFFPAITQEQHLIMYEADNLKTTDGSATINYGLLPEPYVGEYLRSEWMDWKNRSASSFTPINPQWPNKHSQSITELRKEAEPRFVELQPQYSTDGSVAARSQEVEDALITHLSGQLYDLVEGHMVTEHGMVKGLRALDTADKEENIGDDQGGDGGENLA